MAFLYKGTDDWSGVKWCVRTVYWHDSYGINDMLTYGGDYNPDESPENPMVEFYDMDSLIANTETGDEGHDERIKERGQFVSRYYLSTLNGTDRATYASAPQFEDNWVNGLNLHGGEERWSISGEFYTKAMRAVNADFEEWKENWMLEHEEIEDAKV